MSQWFHCRGHTLTSAGPWRKPSNLLVHSKRSKTPCCCSWNGSHNITNNYIDDEPPAG